MHGLLTDRYQLTMAAAYRAEGLHRRRAGFEAFCRTLPGSRRFLVACGIERACQALLDLRFEEADLAYLKAQRDEPAWGSLVEALSELRFRGTVHAVPEGAIVFPGEPLVRVEAALEEGQLVETLLLSILNHDIRVASKAARLRLAARERPVIEFGTRRTHERAAVDAARAAYVGGAAGTSNEEAGRVYGVPVFGTIAHAYVLAHAEAGEEAAFAAYARAFPDGPTLLVDTFDTLRGVERAIDAAGQKLGAIRLDSGDLLELSRGARGLLDAAGLERTRIVASNDLEEMEIARLVAAGAQVDAFGVGTKLVCTPDMAALGAVYKLVSIAGAGGRQIPVSKHSAEKATFPGGKQVFRQADPAGRAPVRDLVALADERAAGEPRLVPWVVDGERVRPPEALDESRARAWRELQGLPASVRALAPATDAERFPVERSAALQALAREVAARGGAPAG